MLININVKIFLILNGKMVFVFVNQDILLKEFSVFVKDLIKVVIARNVHINLTLN